MTKLKTKEKPKIAIGTLIQWYEVEIIPEYVESLVNAIEYRESYDTLYLDFEIYSGTMLEKPIPEISISELVKRINNTLQIISDRFPNINIYVNVVDRLRTIADYRRDFNAVFCTIADVLVWGESDMLVPKEFFTSIDAIHSLEQKDSKYIATFAITKMWDSSWKSLEHPTVKDKEFIDGDTENWWSVRYTMSLSELYEINRKEELFSVTKINPIKFNGCGLVISSELVKSGVNIPSSIFFVHEDTAFMLMCQRMFPQLSQYHFANILLAHNRKHPNKRSYILGEGGIDKTNIGALRKTHDWYPIANKFCETNCHNLFNPNYKAYTWNDVFSKIQH
jgi:hypothetical protein